MSDTLTLSAPVTFVNGAKREMSDTPALTALVTFANGAKREVLTGYMGDRIGRLRRNAH